MPRTSRRKSTPLSPAKPRQTASVAPRQARHLHRLSSREIDERQTRLRIPLYKSVQPVDEEGDTITVNSPSRNGPFQAQPPAGEQELASRASISDSDDNEDEQELELDRDAILENLEELNSHADKLLRSLDREDLLLAITELQDSSSKFARRFHLMRKRLALDLALFGEEETLCLPVDRISLALDPEKHVPELETLLVRANLAYFASSLATKGFRTSLRSASPFLRLSQSTKFPRAFMTTKQIATITDEKFWHDVASLVANLLTQAFIGGIESELDNDDFDAEQELDAAFKQWPEQLRHIAMHKSAKAEKHIIGRIFDLKKFLSRGPGPQVDLLGLRRKYSYEKFVIDAIDWTIASNRGITEIEPMNVGAIVNRLEGRHEALQEHVVAAPEPRNRKSGSDAFAFNRTRDAEASEDEEESEDELESQYRSQSRIPTNTVSVGVAGMTRIEEAEEIECVPASSANQVILRVLDGVDRGDVLPRAVREGSSEPAMRRRREVASKSEREDSVEDLRLDRLFTKAQPGRQHSEEEIIPNTAYSDLHESIEAPEDEGAVQAEPESEAGEPTFVLRPTQEALQVLDASRRAQEDATEEGRHHVKRSRLTERQPDAREVQWDDTQDDIREKRRRDAAEDSEDDEFETIERPSKRPRPSSGKSPSSSAPIRQRRQSPGLFISDTEEPTGSVPREDQRPVVNRPTSSAPNRPTRPGSSHSRPSRQRERSAGSIPPESSLEAYKQARRDNQGMRRDAALLAGINTANSSRPIKPRQIRVGWSDSEIRRLMELMAEFAAAGVHCNWSGMRKSDADMDEPLLQDRDQVALKDKARNMKFDFLAALAPLPAGFEHVTLKKTDIQKLQARGAPIPEWDLERHAREV